MDLSTCNAVMTPELRKPHLISAHKMSREEAEKFLGSAGKSTEEEGVLKTLPRSLLLKEA